jgi:hypothetical protein
MKNRIHDNPVLQNRIEFKELCEDSNGTRTVAEITLKSGGRSLFTIISSFQNTMKCWKVN